MKKRIDNSGNYYLHALRGLYFKIRNLDRFFIKERNLNLSPTELNVIRTIKESSKKTMSFVAQKLAVTIGTLTTSINNLVKKGFVIRRSDEDDKRIVLLELTEASNDIINARDEYGLKFLHNAFIETNIEISEEDVSKIDRLLRYVEEKY